MTCAAESGKSHAHAGPSLITGNPLALVGTEFVATTIWRRFFKHSVRLALSFTWDNTGKSRAARIPMMAMTTNNSINVNARRESMLDKTTLAVFCFKLIPRDAARRRAGCLTKFAWGKANNQLAAKKRKMRK